MKVLLFLMIFLTREETLLEAGRLQIIAADKRIEEGKILLEALPVDKLIQYGDQQDKMYRDKWEGERPEREARREREKEKDRLWEEYITASTDAFERKWRGCK